MDFRIIDTNARYHGLSPRILMENAGRGIADHIYAKYSPKQVGIICGTGNNGGDGYVIARHLESKSSVDVLLPRPPDNIRTQESKDNFKLLEQCNVNVKVSASPPELDNYDIIVDALLGIGGKGEVREPYASYIKKMNSTSSPKISVDIPSGWGSSLFVMAKEVLSPHEPKINGALTIPIGIPHKMSVRCGPGNIKHLFMRPSNSHKRSAGVCAIVGGSEMYHGAPMYASMAASSIADLSYAICPENVCEAIKAQGPDIITIPQKGNNISHDVSKAIASTGADCAAIGMGAGRSKETVDALLATYESLKIPHVIDADGLYALIGHLDAINDLMCLTPHVKEYERLFGKVPSTQEAKMNAVKEAAHDVGCTILLKGSTDIISNGTETWYNTTGNRGMTTGGTGDVLAGCVCGFSAKNPLFESACAGAFGVGLAGDSVFATHDIFYTAYDVVAALPETLSYCVRF